jgi:hypothetical protein
VQRWAMTRMVQQRQGADRHGWAAVLGPQTRAQLGFDLRRDAERIVDLAHPAGTRLSALPELFAIEFFELCPDRRKPPLEYIDDLIADLGRGENGSVYKSAPAIDLILSTDDYFVGIAIHDDQALGFLNLLHQIIDGHDLTLHWCASEMGPRAV